MGVCVTDPISKVCDKMVDIQPLSSQEVAWQEILAFVAQREQNISPTSSTDAPYKWRRKDGYEDGRYSCSWNLDADS